MKFATNGIPMKLIVLATAGSLAAWSAGAIAESGRAAGSGMGPGMMSGAGARQGPQEQQATGGYGRGYGMGPGMMRGWGEGYGMGRGMMGGYGMGPGMMHGWGEGYGMGPGMMYGYAHSGAILGLSDEQAAKIEAIQSDAWKKQWDLAGKTFSASAKLREQFANETPDRKAVDSAYKALADLHLQQIDSRLDARAKIDAVLTKEQRERLQEWRRGGFAPGY